jgi:oligopeptide/dipeptide ABC transporter ATP-binding protein
MSAAHRAGDVEAAGGLPALLAIRGLSTWFRTRHGVVHAVEGVDLDVFPGECVGVVGESGSGKSVTFASVMGLVHPPGRIERGSIHFDGRDLAQLTPRELRAIRGSKIALTMQDALAALNPAFTVGTQIVEVLEVHDRTGVMRGRRARRRALELMGMVGIPDPGRRIDNYPHQFSGGMRQRIVIAIALACEPRLLIADEPTTALDVTIQAQILDLIADLRRRLGTSVVLITHDLGVVAEQCDRVAVMYAGEVVEVGPTAAVIADPRHPYTQALLAALPRLDTLDRPPVPIEGQVPDLAALHSGCRFAPRCRYRRAACSAEIAMRSAGVGREARCVLVGG